MKKITFLLSLILSTMAHGQIVSNGDFQTGTAAPWYGNAANVVDLGGGSFVNEANIIAVSAPSDVNLSQNVLLTDGLTYQLSFDAFTDALTGTRTILVGLGQNNQPYSALTATPVLTATPQTYTYQFTINYGEVVGDRVFFDMGAELGFVFIDNVVVTQVVNTCANGVQDGTETGIDCGGFCPACPGQGPLVPAPTPIQLPSNVISMFSNAYTNVPVDTWRTSWSQATLTDLQIEGNATKRYTSLSFVGIETILSQINATGMTHFHVDVWTPNMTSFKIKLVDFGANAAYLGGDDKEHELTFTPTLNGWNSYDIPLSNFTGLTTRAHIAQLIFSGNPSGSGTVFIDNVYFRTGALSIDQINSKNITLYPNPATNVLNIEAATAIEKVSIYNILGQEVISKFPNTELVTLDVSSLQLGVYIVKTSINGNVSSTRFIKE